MKRIRKSVQKEPVGCGANNSVVDVWVQLVEHRYKQALPRLLSARLNVAYCQLSRNSDAVGYCRGGLCFLSFTILLR